MATHTYPISASSLKKRKNVTAEELYLLPRKPFYELYDGVLQVREGSGSESSNIAAELIVDLGLHVRAHRLGRVFGADHRCLISRNPDTVLIPDASFVRNERLAYSTTWDRFFDGSPDLVVEVMSLSDRLRALERKIERYLIAGTSLAWIIQPRKRRALIYRNDGATAVIAQDGVLDGENVVPRFTCQLSGLFVPNSFFQA